MKHELDFLKNYFEKCSPLCYQGILSIINDANTDTIHFIIGTISDIIEVKK